MQIEIVFVVIVFSFFILFFLWQAKSNKFEQKFSDKFKAFSYDLMEKNSKQFFELAKAFFDKHQEKSSLELDKKQQQIKSLLSPLSESLQKMEGLNRDIEKQRHQAYSSLYKQIDVLIQSEQCLCQETVQLSKALKSPNIRGGWGQLQLKRVVELAGMINRCDFFEQTTKQFEDKTYRPDMIIRLPGEREIIVDAKTPIDAYMQAFEAKDEKEKQEKLVEHAKQLRKHIRDLSTKQYWKVFSHAPEYVILFLPLEALFSTALQIDPSLLEEAIQDNIIIATPTTLIAVLRAVAYGWKQEKLSKSAQEIASIGKELYSRLYTMTSHMKRLGKSISSSVDSYNQVLSSFETRVLVSARKLKEMGLSMDKREIDYIQTVDKTTRSSATFEEKVAEKK